MLQLASGYEVLGTCRRIKESVPDRFLPREMLVEGIHANDLPSVIRCISKVEPDTIVNCIGIVKQSNLAHSPVPSILINSLFPHQLAEICNERQIRVIHFSTDCVFSGRKGRYGLNDFHDAEDLYGRTKSLGELNETEGVTIRSSIIGRELESSNGLLEWLASNKGKKVHGFTKAIFSGFTTHEMANIVKSILAHPQLRGTYQVASTPISKFDLICAVATHLGLDVAIEPYADFHCDRSLDGSLFECETGYEPPSWKRMIEDMAKDWYAYDELRGGFR
jgi:dTDP-4-dehydrorhamnose reductase